MLDAKQMLDMSSLLRQLCSEKVRNDGESDGSDHLRLATWEMPI